MLEGHSVAVLLSKLPPFAALDQACLRSAAAEFVERPVTAGQMIFSGQDNAEGLYVLADGSISLTRTTLCGKQTWVSEEHALSVLATVGLLDGGTNYVAARAVSDSLLYVMEASVFERFCGQSAAIPIAIAAGLSRQLRLATQFTDLLMLGSVRQRLAYALMQLWAVNGPCFTLPCTREELAERIGTVREVLFRNLRQLQIEHVLHFERRVIVIDDPPALQVAADVSSSTPGVIGCFPMTSVPAYVAVESLRVV